MLKIDILEKTILTVINWGHGMANNIFFQVLFKIIGYPYQL